jgi:hypothetical protein
MTSIVQIVNFQITPYSDTIAKYISSLDEENIYKIFSNDMPSDILTAALYAIYKLESTARNIILQKSDINQSYALREANRLCPDSYKSLNPKVLNSLGDVYLRDNLLFSENINDLRIYPNVFVLIVNGIYAGHIYAWIIDGKGEPGTEGISYKITNVIGIRNSILQLLVDSCGLRQSSVAPIFFNAIHIWSAEQGSNYIRVLQPIGPMPNLLIKCGFIMTKPLRNKSEFRWLFDNNSIGDTSLASMLIFREHDYIIQISDQLKCKTPDYKYLQL